MTSWASRTALRTLHAFRARVARYQLQQPRFTKRALRADPLIAAAVRAHAAEHGMTEDAVRRRVDRYLDEIVPHFNILTYYKFGYNVAKALVNLLYKVSVDHQDEEALARIPKHDVVVYLMNHRSNADYVVVAYVLAYGVHVSYAVGEWARAWPLEYVFKSFGSYFIRRRFREALYHTVLERYVQLITRNGVTQGLFPEGGLTRDGALLPPKLGLLGYLVRTVADPAFTDDVWLVPVGINYDRVLEDRVLIQERIVGGRPPSRLRQLARVARYLGLNLLRFLTGRLRRYGRVAVSLGTPISVRDWLAQRPEGLLQRPWEEQKPHIYQLAELAMERIGAVVPVTPVPLAAAALLSFRGSVVPRDRLLDRMDELRDRLRASGARIVRDELPVTEVWDRAWRMLRLRALVLAQGDELVVLPGQRPLLEYYANSIRHLLPRESQTPTSPAHEPDPTLPRLATRDEARGASPRAPGSPRR